MNDRRCINFLMVAVLALAFSVLFLHHKVYHLEQKATETRAK